VQFLPVVPVHCCTLMCTFYYKKLDFISIHPEMHSQYYHT